VDASFPPSWLSAHVSFLSHANITNGTLTSRFEASPFCRRVREALVELKLDTHVRPCPRSTLTREGFVDDTHKHRAAAMELTLQGGWAADSMAFPLMLDRTEGKPIRESKEIVAHLWKHYGQDLPARQAEVHAWVQTSEERQQMWVKRLASLPGQRLFVVKTFVKMLSGLLADGDLPGLLAVSICRPHAGVMIQGDFFGRSGSTNTGTTLAKADSHDLPTLELWGVESCPRARLLRESLCEEQRAYIFRPAERGCVRLRAAHGEEANTPFLTDTSVGGFALCCDNNWALGDALRRIRGT
jgi:hypothetical protein